MPQSPRITLSRDEIESILNDCIDQLFKNDLSLLVRDVSERAITHKLAEYLQRQIPDLDVDCEYNRNGTEPKTIQTLRHNARKHFAEMAENLTPEEKFLSLSTYPDIIVHCRESNEHNLLVIEVKKSNSGKDYQHDLKKLEAFTEYTEQNSYHYRYGVFMVLETGTESPQRPEFIWYSEGRHS